jgi:hypothetical protein
MRRSTHFWPLKPTPNTKTLPGDSSSAMLKENHEVKFGDSNKVGTIGFIARKTNNFSGYYTSIILENYSKIVRIQ